MIAEEESEDTDDTHSVESYPNIDPIGDIDRTATGMLTSDSDILSSGTPGISPSPARTRCHGKAKKKKDREPFYNGYGVVFLPGDINGVVHVLDAFLRLKQLTRREYTDITARLAASL